MDNSDLTPMPSDPTGTPENRNLTAKTVIGDEIKKLESETLGQLDNLMLDIEGGRVEYGVMKHGGVLEVGEKLFATRSLERLVS